jgi:hypothetical protein
LKRFTMQKLNTPERGASGRKDLNLKWEPHS